MALDTTDTAFDQYIIPGIVRASGVYEIRLSITRADFDMAAVVGKTVLTLDSPSRLVTAFDRIKKRRVNEDGRLTMDGWGFTARDVFEYAGTAVGGSFGGTPVDVASDVSRYGMSFWDLVFQDPTAKVWLYLSRQRRSDDTWERVFHGRVDQTGMTRINSFTDAAHTSAEVALRPLQVKATAAIDLAEETVADFLATVLSTDMASATVRPFFMGFVPHGESSAGGGLGSLEQAKRGDLDPDLWGASWADYSLLAAMNRRGYYVNDAETPYAAEPPAWPDGIWGITYGKILVRLFAMLGWHFTEATGVGSAFSFYEEDFNGAVNYYELGSEVAAKDIVVSFNHLVGLHPIASLASTTFSSPVTFERAGLVRDILRAICLRLGAFLDVSYDQTTGRPTVALKSLRATNGTLPALLKARQTSEISEQGRQIGKQRVRVTMAGSEDVASCPAGLPEDAPTIEVEIRWRTGAAGRFYPGSPTFARRHVTLDAGRDPWDQWLCAKVFDAESANKLNADGWTGGAFIYSYRDATSGAAAYPASVTPAVNAQNFRDASFEGFHRLRVATEKALVWENRDDNPLFAACQLYARELLGDRRRVKRTYASVVGDTDSIGDLQLCQIETMTVGGVVGTYRALEIEIDIDADASTYAWEIAPDYGDLDDLPVAMNETGKQSGSVGGSTSGTGSSNSGSSRPGIDGSGTADRVAVWSGTSSLRAGPLVTETNTVGLGVGVTAEPTDSFFYINVGPTGGFSALHLESSEITNDVAALVIDSASRGGGALITQTSVTADSDPLPAPALRLINAHARALGLDVSCTDATHTYSRGIRSTMPAAGIGIAGEFIDNGTGGAILTNGSTSLRVPAASTTVMPLSVRARTTTTVTAIEVHAGTGSALDIQRASGAGNSAALVRIDATTDAESALEIIHSTGTGRCIDIATSGSGHGINVAMAGTGAGIVSAVSHVTSTAAAISASHAGLGPLISAIGSNAASTAAGVNITLAGTGNVYSGTANGNGRVFYGIRNVSGATADLVTIHVDHAGDAGVGLAVIQDGISYAADLITTGGGTVIRVRQTTATTTLPGISSETTSDSSAFVGIAAGNRPAVVGQADGIGDGIEGSAAGPGYGGRFTGGIITDTLRITAGSPVAGMWPVYQGTTGVLAPGHARGLDTECLVSILTGDDALGNIVFAALDAPVQIPLDTANPIVCNDQWDDTTNLGLFTPTKNLDPSDSTTTGVTSIRVTFWATKPGGWTNSDITLWIKKGAVFHPIGGSYISAGLKIIINGTFDDAFTGSQSYSVWISQNVAAGMNTLTTWDCRVSTVFEHTDDCAACSA